MTYLQRHKYSRKDFGDVMDRVEVYSTPRRKKRAFIKYLIISAVIIAFALFVVIRLAKAAGCAEQGGYYEQMTCKHDSQCCEVVHVDNSPIETL